MQLRKISSRSLRVAADLLLLWFANNSNIEYSPFRLCSCMFLCYAHVRKILLIFKLLCFILNINNILNILSFILLSIQFILQISYTSCETIYYCNLIVIQLYFKLWAYLIILARFAYFALIFLFWIS